MQNARLNGQLSPQTAAMKGRAIKQQKVTQVMSQLKAKEEGRGGHTKNQSTGQQMQQQSSPQLNGLDYSVINGGATVGSPIYRRNDSLNRSGGFFSLDEVNDSGNLSSSFDQTSFVLAREIERLNSDMLQYERIIQSLRDTNSHLCSINGDAMQKVERYEAEKHEMQAKIDGYEKTIIVLDDTINRLESRIEEKKNHFNNIVIEFNNEKQKIADDAVSRLSIIFHKEASEMEKQNAELRGNLEKAMASGPREERLAEDFADLKLKYESLEMVCVEAEQLEIENKQLKEQVRQLQVFQESSVLGQREIIGLRGNLDQYRATIEQLQNVLMQQDIKFKEIKEQLSDSEGRAQTALKCKNDALAELQVMMISIQCKDSECDELAKEIAYFKKAKLSVSGSMLRNSQNRVPDIK